MSEAGLVDHADVDVHLGACGMKDRRRGPRGAQRGAVLFEVMLSVALFVGAAAFTLAAVRSGYQAIERVRLQNEAVDLAKSKLAELEAGLISLADLTSDGGAHHTHDWVLDVKSRRTQFTGLTLIELTVTEDIAETADRTPMSYTLRQLAALRPGEGGDEE